MGRSHSELSLDTYAVPSASLVEIVVPVKGVVRIVRASSSAGADVLGRSAKAGRADKTTNTMHADSVSEDRVFDAVLDGNVRALLIIVLTLGQRDTDPAIHGASWSSMPSSGLWRTSGT